MKDESKLPGVMRGVPPCKGCEERHTACHDNCPKYKAWKAETERIKEAKRAYEAERYAIIEEQKRRKSWGRNHSH